MLRKNKTAQNAREKKRDKGVNGEKVTGKKKDKATKIV